MSKNIKEETDMPGIKTSSNCLTYSIPEIAEMLGINIVSAYNLAKQQNFPAIRIGRRIVVPKTAFDRWLDQAAGMAEER